MLIDFAKYRYSLLLILLLLSACDTPQSTDRFRIDTQQDRVEVVLQPFYKDLITIDTLQVAQGIAHLSATYPTFYSYYLQEIMGRNEAEKDSIEADFYGFLTNKEVYQLHQQVLTTYPDLRTVSDPIVSALTYLHHYFPDIKLPKITFFVSGLYQKIVYQAEELGVGIDFYLGKEYPHYSRYFYDYQQYHLQPKFLTIDIVETIIRQNIHIDTTQQRLIEHMIAEGKIAYLTKICLPETPISDILGYAPSHYQWAVNQESKVWKIIVGKKELFTTNQQLISRYIHPAPFTAPISQSSPDRLGVFIGYRIIENYMRHHPQTTLPQLVKMTDAQDILNNSKYQM